MREELKLITSEEPITLLDILTVMLPVIVSDSNKLEDPLDTYSAGEDNCFLPESLQEFV